MYRTSKINNCTKCDNFESKLQICFVFSQKMCKRVSIHTDILTMQKTVEIRLSLPKCDCVTQE